jgi:predicted nucleic acid-binding protein
LRRFFDSSVLIPAFYKFDAHHESSAKALHSASRENSLCALRTLGEVYAVLTGLPLRPRITGTDGMAIVEQIREKLTVISLTEQEYVSVIQSVSETIVGGATYDALIAQCAYKALHAPDHGDKVSERTRGSYNHAIILTFPGTYLLSGPDGIAVQRTVPEIRGFCSLKRAVQNPAMRR